MKPKKFIGSYKCDCFQPANYCNCRHKIISQDVFMENVTDVVKQIITVMKLCGIFLSKSQALEDVIIYHFLHFEEIMHRIDAVPRKRLNKEDLMHDLGRKCVMNRREAQMTYSIIKRAFRAFYHGTGMGGAPISLAKNKSKHTSQCLWVHAAHRTAQTYASYESVFYAFKKNLEMEIRSIYLRLHDRISKRSPMCEEHECICPHCAKRIAKETLKTVTVTTGMHVVNDKYEAEYLEEQKQYADNRSLFRNSIASTQFAQSISDSAKKGHTPSSFLSLSGTEKDNFYRENAKYTATGASQGSFYCQWLPVSQEEFEADKAETRVDINLPEEFPCPPCYSDAEYESEYECRCEDCTCKSDSEIGYENETATDQEYASEEMSMASGAVTTTSNISAVLDTCFNHHGFTV